MITKIFRHLWFGYAALIFMINMLIFSPIYLLIGYLFKERASRFLIVLSHYVVSRTIRWPLLIFIKTYGKKHFQKGQTYVIVNNHQSGLDFMVSATACPILYKYLAKKEVLQFPLFGVAVRLFSILVDRKDAKSRAQSIKRMEAALKTGFSVFLYPEGTRNRTSEPLKTFYNGAFKLAIQSQAPLMVGTIVGAVKLMSPHRPFQLSPGIIKVFWEEAVSTENIITSDLEKLKTQTKETMLNRLNNPLNH
ncbi:MAG: 1-acyl-sn-glycerol-3-phosphate acyltransferase [Aureispira sp.]|nr:1-acyl-sn-glycerol-3-phosphate acyltransferase [Aureispira sp.]